MSDQLMEALKGLHTIRKREAITLGRSKPVGWVFHICTRPKRRSRNPGGLRLNSFFGAEGESRISTRHIFTTT